MPEPETAGNPAETDSYEQILKRLDHLDSLLHAIGRETTATGNAVQRIELFIAEHRPALARGLALMDPGAKVRGFLRRDRVHIAPDPDTA